jgi:hypothetical protein
MKKSKTTSFPTYLSIFIGVKGDKGKLDERLGERFGERFGERLG